MYAMGWMCGLSRDYQQILFSQKKARGKFCPYLMQLSVTLYKHDFNSSFTSVKLQVLRSKNVLVLPSTAFYNLNIEKKNHYNYYESVLMIMIRTMIIMLKII